MIELLSPVGNFECLKAAVQNGANAVYFGASSFGARAFAGNFDDYELEKAINYAKLRGVKTHLTLNTLIKEDEFNSAFEIAKKAYMYGIDAIIVQDIGLASKLIESFPDLDIHASTQMTVHNLEGVKELEKLGFKRAVLSRELSLEEINYICKNTNMEIEVFIHGALCISYSGECLFSSMVGGRSGNRGKCAQPCRLPYELIKQTNNNSASKSNINKGYLLSPRDLCGIEFIPNMIKSGVTSLKIEGRMKSPEYVATVTRIYRKYIDLAYDSTKEYVIDENDKKDLMQVFNRGGFSSGHLTTQENRDLIFKEKPNNMGIYLGKISKYNSSKGIVTCNIENTLDLGDSISFKNENTKYTISELINKNGQNIKSATINNTVSFGRMKGNIKIGDKIYKLNSKVLSDTALSSYSKENIKIDLDCNISIKKDKNISVNISCAKFGIETNYTYDYIPEVSQNQPLSQEKIINQFSKTLDTPFVFKNFNIELDNNLFMPVSVLNEIRRTGIDKMETEIINQFKRNSVESYEINHTNNITKNTSETKLSLLLNILNLNYNYDLLDNVDKLYLPLKYFGNNKYTEIIQTLSNKFNLYIYMPIILRKNFIETAKSIINKSVNEFNIKGAVISHFSQVDLFKEFDNLELIGNYTLNIFNSNSINCLKDMNISTVTLSPELNQESLIDVLNSSTLPKEFIVYGNIPIMTMNYCPLGNSNKCYTTCKNDCNTDSKFFLKDRMNMLFRILPDNLQTISTLYNSKINSIDYKDFNLDFARIDILDEKIEQINNIIETVKLGKRFEGKDYTNGNLKKEI